MDAPQVPRPKDLLAGTLGDALAKGKTTVTLGNGTVVTRN
jgi:hypothetical protein